MEDDAARLRRTRKPERRKAERNRSLTAGLLVYGGGAFVVNCLIRDCGAKGAQIRMSTAQPMPNDPFLIDVRGWIAYQAHRVWHRASLAGFSFEKEYLLSGALPPQLEYLRSLFIEAQLRQADLLSAQGLRMPEVLSKLGVTQATYFRWLDSPARLGTQRARARSADSAETPYRL